MATPEDLTNLIKPIAETLGYELVRIRITGTAHKTLQVMAEKPDGTMLVDDCATLSRAISDMLDIEDPIAEDYDLEVSSPGIDRPLTRPKDFARYVGHKAKIELVSADAQGRRRYQVVIAAADDTTVSLAISNDETLTVPFSAIGDAKLVMTDRLIQEAQAARAAKH
ncbi:Ribosome maturation factor RimP [Alphaproteobacteria bacterium SO-S41]|nr:Ribosome maturation factor RimP [Alphaproteobacteria bacterium SO-S41]